MDEHALENLVLQLLEAVSDPDFIDECYEYVDEPDSHVSDVRSFESAMVLTNNRGMVVKFDDGTEFQITIVQSR